MPPDERTARAIRAERDFVELACYRGDARGRRVDLRSPGPGHDGRGAGGLRTRPRRDGRQQIEETARHIVARMVTALGERAGSMAREFTAGDIDKVHDLFGATSSHGRRELGEAVRRHLKAALGERQAS